MKKRILAFLISIFVVVSTCLGGAEFSVHADDTDIYNIDVTYCQTEARSMLDYVNDLRTGDDAWYWDSDDETTITCSDLSGLEYDYELEKVAMQRAAELAVYFSHTRPNGETTWTAFTDYSYSYTSVGENIAAGYSSASSAFTGWAEADEDYSGQGHRRNMLSSSFTRIGIACVKYNGRYYWAMELAKSSVSNSETTATDGAKTVSIEIADSSITSISTTASVSSYSLFVGDTADLPVITASFATSEIWPTTSTATATADATWSSSNTDYVTVSDSEITAVASGQAEITATAYGDTFEIPVSVYSEPTFDWDSEYLTCTAIFTCGNDSEEVDCTVTNTESVDPTCTEAGYIVYEAECTFGGSTFSDSVTETVEATGHTMEMTEAVDATCEEAGNSEYYTCTECGKYYSDEDGSKEIEEDSWVIDATGHTMEKTAAIDATCEEEGNIEYYTCTECGKYYSDEAGTDEIEEDSWIIEATGHTLEMTAATEPTCITEGNSEYYTCTVCGNYYSDASGCNEIDENSWIISETDIHTWDDGTVLEEATCIDEGEVTYTCVVCGETKTEEIPATGHTLEVTEAMDATCEEDGNSKYYTCTTCGGYFSDASGDNEIDEGSWVIDATGHTMEMTEAVDETCTTDGNDKYYTCTECGKYYSDASGDYEIEEDSWIIKATGHTWEVTSTTEATCTTAGEIEYTCTECGETKTEEIPATGHTWDSGTVTKAATCQATGEKTYTCSVCGETKTETIAKTDHTSVSFAKKAATTSANGYTAGTKCSVCGTVLSGKETVYKIKSVTLKTTSYTYNGSAKKPGVTVKDSQGNTISSSNYTVTYKNNKKVGKATVTVKFKNNYSGTVTKTFKINPKGTTVSSVTKGSKSFTVKWKKQSTKMSTSTITGYQIQYSTSSSFSSGNKTVTVSGYSKTSKKITGLKSNKKYYVRIRTYKSIDGTKYYSSWSSAKSVTTK